MTEMDTTPPVPPGPPGKLDTAGVLERVFDVYRQQFGVIIPAALVVFLPVAVVAALALSEGSLLLALVASIISFVGTFWFQGVVVEAVRDIQDGRRDFTVGQLFESVRPVLAPLIGIGVLAGLGIAVGFVLLIVPGLILLTWWAVIAPVIVIERGRAMDAFGRSRELVRGNGWPVFGVIVFLFFVNLVVTQIIRAIAGDSFAGGLIASLISNVLVAPLSAIAAAVIYLSLRRLKGEALPPAA
jgi:hypothetical protein